MCRFLRRKCMRHILELPKNIDDTHVVSCRSLGTKTLAVSYFDTYRADRSKLSRVRSRCVCVRLSSRARFTSTISEQLRGLKQELHCHKLARQQAALFNVRVLSFALSSAAKRNPLFAPLRRHPSGLQVWCDDAWRGAMRWHRFARSRNVGCYHLCGLAYRSAHCPEQNISCFTTPLLTARVGGHICSEAVETWRIIEVW